MGYFGVLAVLDLALLTWFSGLQRCVD